MGHLSKLQDEFGKKGLHVIAINNENRDMHLRYLVHQDPGFTYKLAIGGGSAYEVKGIPHAYLIDPEGVVVWEGSPSSMSEKKDLGPALKMVRKPTDEERAARADKMLQFAQSLAADNLVVRAEAAFGKVAETYPGTDAAETAKELAKSMSSDANEAEFDAQQDIAKIVGGIEAPDPGAKKAKGKQLERAAKKLRAMAEDLAETAPRAAKLADEWATIFETPWQ